MTAEERLVLHLVRLANGSQDSDIDLNVYWQKVFTIACQQGVSCLAFDGLEKLVGKRGKGVVPTEFTLQLYAKKTQTVKAMQEKRSLILEFAEQMQPYQGYILKGLDFARYWTNPLYREYGDFDCYYGSDFENVNKKAVEVGLKEEGGTYKHSHIYYKGLMIENHQTFTDYDGSKIGEQSEKMLDNLLALSKPTEIEDGILLAPNPTFTACFMLKHAQGHFITEGVELRHFLDWMYFVDKCGDKVDWNKIVGTLERMKLKNFFDMVNQYCITRLGWRNKIIENLELRVESTLLERIDDFVFSEKANISNRNLFYVAKRLLNRFVRAWHFRKLHYLPYHKAVWTWIAYASTFDRRPEL